MQPFEAKHITLALLKIHGRENWRVTINTRTKVRAGLCDYRICTIDLSAWLFHLNSDEAIMNTITHEVAHAIVGGWCGHNHMWRQCHRRLGGNGKTRYKPGEDLTNGHVRKRQARNWIGNCFTCGEQYTRVRISRRAGTYYRCPRDKTRLVWKNEKTGEIC